MQSRRWVLRSALLVLATSWTASGAENAAALRLPAIFSDNMVLQQGIPVPVWGWAGAQDQITVTCQNQRKTTTAGQDGKWMVKLDPLALGGSFDLTVSGKSSVTFKNVLAGEVWICSGQSNMEWVLRNTNDAPKEIAASKNPMIRLFTVKKNIADQPQSDLSGQWQECTPEASPGFSAVGYYFGKELQKTLNVPIGLIHTSWGGTPIEAWTSQPVLTGDPDMKVAYDNYTRAKANHEPALKKWAEAAAAAKKEGKPAPRRPSLPWAPSGLYNGMIAPLVPYGLAGAIWYQGESNAGNAQLYRKQMPAMIKNWRDDWGQGEFPFFMVSLANYMARKDAPADSAWAELREAQALTAANTPKVGVAMAIDIGEANDIHPRNKADVGKRLALNALAIGYGKSIVYSGPVYDSMKIEGNAIRLSFKHTGTGLLSKDGTLKGFAVAGEDRKFVWAEAKIEGQSIVVSAKDVARPVAVRYAWADNPECNLYNQEGLPAVPFRTDQWPRGAAR